MSINPGKKEIESLKEAVAYVETMEKDLREMEAAYDELVEKCDRLERELKEAKEDEFVAIALHKEVDSLNKRLQAAENDRERLERELKEAKVDELDATALHRAVYSASCENITLHQKMEVLEKQLESVKKDRDNISSDYDDACHEIDGLRSAIDKLKNDIACRIPSVLLQALIDDILDSDAEWVKTDILDFFDRMLKRMKERELDEIDSDPDR